MQIRARRLFGAYAGVIILFTNGMFGGCTYSATDFFLGVDLSRQETPQAIAKAPDMAAAEH